jgi:hypothetical protein
VLAIENAKGGTLGDLIKKKSTDLLQVNTIN